MPFLSGRETASSLGGVGFVWAIMVKEGEDGPDTYEWDEGIAP